LPVGDVWACPTICSSVTSTTKHAIFFIEDKVTTFSGEVKVER
jgi:hypothetical protein